MTNHLIDDLFPVLQNERRLDAASIQDEELVICLNGRTLRLCLDGDHGRTVCSAGVRRLAYAELAAAEQAALRFNGSPCAERGVVAGLFKARNFFVVGKSVDVACIAPAEALALAQEVAEAAEAAGALLDQALQGRDAPLRPVEEAERAYAARV